MADDNLKAETLTQGPGLAATSRHAELVAGFRAKLAGKKSLLDSVSMEQLEQARKELSELPEVAGEPLPARRFMSR